MRKLKACGLVMVFAVIGAGGAVVASASAALPEFKATSFPVTFTSVSILPLEPNMHSSVLGEKNMACKMSNTLGEVKNTKEVSKVIITYTECEEEGTTNSCTKSGEAAGTIKTKPIEARVDYVLPRSGKTTGIELEPETGTVFAEFTCTGVAGKVTVEGCTIGEVTPINVFQTTGEVLYEENSAKNGQLYTELEGGVHKPCELTVTASIFKLKGKGWLMARTLVTFSTNIELQA